MSDVTSFRRPETGAAPPRRPGSSAASRPTLPPLKSPWPRGQGYFAERPSTREWASHSAARPAPVPPPPARPDRTESVKRALALLGLILLLGLCILGFKYGMFTKDVDATNNDDFWDDTNTSSQVAIYPPPVLTHTA